MTRIPLQGISQPKSLPLLRGKATASNQSGSVPPGGERVSLDTAKYTAAVGNAGSIPATSTFGIGADSWLPYKSTSNRGYK